MICTLCDQPVTLFDLGDLLDGGMPVHDSCRRAYDAELAAVLATAEAMVLAEPDPRRHRQGVTLPAYRRS